MGREGALFETMEAMRSIGYKVYVFSVLMGIVMIWGYRATHIPAAGEKGRWAWMGLFASELWFGLYWLLTQSVRWKPVYRHTFRDRLTQRYKEDNLPGVDVFVCTADPKMEPPSMVMNTVLSVMAYDYPATKLSVYLSDDGGSELTFYSLIEASRFAENWIPFCHKFKIEPRSPAAYFAESEAAASSAGPDDAGDAVEWTNTKRLYEEMESRIHAVVESGRIPDYIRKQHKGFSQWNTDTTRGNHPPIVEIIINGRDESSMDKKASILPTLVYVAREKRPHRHHNFKAGAMNSLIRVSSVISKGAVILNVDCDMYSNNSGTIKDALCFLMDEDEGHEIAYVQLPQHFNNITKNDIYGSSLRTLAEVDFHGFDGHGGPMYIGSGCYHRRECLLGKKYDGKFKAELKSVERGHATSVSTLEEKARSLITCTFEDNTEWGKEVGLKYGCPVEDVITGLSIQCRGWRSVYFNPQRQGFIGVAPVALAQHLVQHKRWSEGDLQVFLSKYSPLVYGQHKIKLGLQMAYSIYLLWAPCSFPTLYYVVIPPLFLLHHVPLFPNVSDIWFVPFAYVTFITSIYSLWESLHVGYTLKGWWNEKRMYLYRRLASYPFAVFDTLLRLTGIGKSTFVITAKVADEDLLRRYEQEMIEFGSPPSLMYTILSASAMLSLVCLVGAAKRVVIEGAAVDSILVQAIICAAILLINIPVFEAMSFRADAGRMPTSVTLVSIGLVILACVVRV